MGNNLPIGEDNRIDRVKLALKKPGCQGHGGKQGPPSPPGCQGNEGSQGPPVPPDVDVLKISTIIYVSPQRIILPNSAWY